MLGNYRVATQLAAFRAVLISTKLVFLRSVLQLLVANFGPSSTIIATLMMEAIRSSEASNLIESNSATSQKTEFFNSDHVYVKI
jgi:hypothetical protein